MYIESLLTDAIQRVIKGSQDHPGIETKIRARNDFISFGHLIVQNIIQKSHTIHDTF